MAAPQGDELFAAAFLLLLAVLALRYFLRVDHAMKKPPVARGWPLLGSVLDLGKDPAGFLSRCHKKYGDIFTLQLATQRMTFLMDASHFRLFFDSPDRLVTFRPAVEQFTARVFGLPSSIFFPHHFNMLQTLRSMLSLGTISPLLLEIAERVDAQLDQLPPEGQGDLVELLRRVTFNAALDTLFGEAFGKRHGHAALLSHFSTFEWEFEKAASPIPHLFQPQFRKSRAALLEAFRASLEAGDFNGSEVAPALLREVPLPRSLQPNVLLALIWAAQSNTIPAVFWAVSFLLLPEHAPHLHAVRTQVQDKLFPPLSSPCARSQTRSLHTEDTRTTTSAAMSTPCQLSASRETARSCRPSIGADPQGSDAPTDEIEGAEDGSKGKGGGGPVEESSMGSGPSRESVHEACARAALERQGALAQCVSETLRLRAQGIEIRVAAAPLILPDFIIPRGDILALSPYEAHHDPRLFEDPLTFEPSRWSKPSASGEVKGEGKSAAGRSEPTKVTALPQTLSFGGGKYRCPGRFFAEAEIRAIAALFLYRLDVFLEQKGGKGEGKGTGLVYSGYGNSVLPPADMSRLVGVKAPIGICNVRFLRR